MASRAGISRPIAVRALILCGISIACAPKLQAQTVQELGNLSIEELSEVQVTSVTKRPEPLSEAAAAVYVITADDIVRSGATTLGEALRLAPNLEVARLNAFDYTVTARGFNSPESANKLQVLIDGRSVYSPLASTVFWDAVDVPLDNIARIEVISGPGGTLYGANAVNGVINIITKNSQETQGGFADLGAGTLDRSGLLRYGGRIGETATYRVYGYGFNQGPTIADISSEGFNDSFRGGQTGFRIDGHGGPNTYMAEGDFYDHSIVDNFEELRGGDLNTRWSRALDDDATVSLQAYFSRDDRQAPTLTDRLDTYDIQAQHNLNFGPHEIVWGAEAHLWQEGLFSSGPFFFETPQRLVTLGNVFAEDEITLNPRLKLTLGFKAEDNNYSGIDLLPDFRLGWQAARRNFVWAAISKAVRTPSRIDRELVSPDFLLASPDFESEKLTAFQLGYRGQPTERSALSVSAFYNIYDDLRTDELTPSGLIMLGNGLAGDTYGIEAWGSYSLFDWWRLRPGISWLHKNLHLKPGHTDISELQAAGQDPAYQAQLRSEMNLSARLEFDVALRDVGPVMRAFVPGALVPGYVEADARLAWHATRSLEFEIDGFNLLHPHHLEVFDPSTSPPQLIPRSVFIRLRASF